jgi:periplasmic protein CpxP/Spy
MSTQTKSKLFLLIIVILLLTNITLLFFLFSKDDGGGKKTPFDRGAAAKDFLRKEIGFTDAQLQHYDTLANQHRDKMKGTFDEMRKSKEELFKELGRRAFSDSAIADAITQSVEKQKIMELQFYNHMLEVRKICTADQLPKFDSLFYKMWSKKPKKPEEKEKK